MSERPSDPHDEWHLVDIAGWAAAQSMADVMVRGMGFIQIDSDRFAHALPFDQVVARSK